ncbi:DegT/DnrJ/EryC1/StrS family aminotransferase [Amycolatopsis vancoresmycina]|uniref:DegT/DnrJ/EryC1/StrS aminotransferase n=1 Tax=Amycolatopsis vancoresmycina DSM 44592 TaxID=1292037 RepID=R1G4E7_9PSEU|nr:DegT/DnrJ/EryC1/StrS family aminotransferase [Amycolatopsis vancoresmycina]EOD66353.1 DegT/DnrJ/EryC1/StrS aminotransferase [Amycolatopsis vancoresmycina DSM 44592]
MSVTSLPRKGNDPAAGSTPIPFFSQAAGFRRLWPEIEERLHEVADSGKFSHGAQVARLEHRLAEYTGAAHVVGVNSGTDALILLLRACGLGEGAGVLVPAFTFVATATSVVHAGGRPQFTDIDPATYQMCPEAAERAITPRTRAVMPVHLFDRMADVAAFATLAARHGLTLLEDSAEAIGMRRQGKHAGLHGVGGVLSFFPSKTLGALGDAGAVLTDDAGLAAKVAALRHHGRPGATLGDFPAIRTGSELAGVNSKTDDVQAAVLLAKLSALEQDIARRAELAAAYTERLSGTPGVRRVPGPVTGGGDDRDVCYVYVVEVDDRDGLASTLAAAGIGTDVFYPVPLHLQPCFADLAHRPGDFPHAEAACRHTIALPLYPDLTLAEVDRVCAEIRRHYTGSAS